LIDSLQSRSLSRGWTFAHLYDQQSKCSHTTAGMRFQLGQRTAGVLPPHDLPSACCASMQAGKHDPLVVRGKLNCCCNLVLGIHLKTSCCTLPRYLLQCFTLTRI